MRYNSSENGRTMIEMLGVLAIVGILSTGGIAGYSKAMAKHKINKTTEQLALISVNIKSLFLSHRNYQGVDDINTLIAMNVFPKEMISNTASESTEGTQGIVHGPRPGSMEDGLNGNLIGPGSPVMGQEDPDPNSPIRHSFKHSVTVASADKNTDNDKKAFVITFNGLPSQACSAIASQSWSNSGESLISIGINSSESMTSPDCESSSSLFCGNDNVKVSDILSACKNESNNVSFKFN